MFAIPPNQKFNFLCSGWFASLRGRKRNTTRLPRKALLTGDNPDRDFQRSIKLKQTNKQMLWNIDLNLHSLMTKTTLASFLHTLFQFDLNFDLFISSTNVVTVTLMVLQRIVRVQSHHRERVGAAGARDDELNANSSSGVSEKQVERAWELRCLFRVRAFLFKFAKFKKEKEEEKKKKVNRWVLACQGGTDFLSFYVNMNNPVL